MAKYLIQDIVPNDKKRRIAVAKEGALRTEEVAPYEARGHSVIHREHTDARHEEMESRAVSSEASDHEDPRSIISKHMASTPDRMIEEDDNGEEDAINSIHATKTKTPAGAQLYNGGVIDPRYASPERNAHWGGVVAGGDFGKTWLPWVVGALLVVVCAVLIFNFFASATVMILPKRQTLSLEQQMTAIKNPTNGELPYSVMKVSLTETKEIPATGEKTVVQKASGRIIVYNTQTVTQRLIKNTRFQSTAGKIYRINDSINIPKATTLRGKTTPGNIEVTVFADDTGPDYNSLPTDFTVPGLKGSPTFEKVYARSTGAIAGGASGTIKSVSDQDLKQASADLRVALETKLRSKARGDLAPSQIGYDGGIVVQMKDAVLSNAAASSVDKAVVSEEGTLLFVVFDRKELIAALAQSLIPKFFGEEVSIKNLESLELALPANIEKSIDLWSSEKINFTLKGTPVFEWVINEADVKKILLNAPKASFNALLVQFSAIDRAKATIQPAWKRTFPDKVEDIKVEIVATMPE